MFNRQTLKNCRLPICEAVISVNGSRRRVALWVFWGLVLTGCTVSFSGAKGRDGGGGDAAADAAVVCGDGVLQGDETCDGTDLGGATCESLGFLGGVLVCSFDCTFITAGCTAPVCGDEVIEGDEVCDADNLRGETCASLDRGQGTLACLEDCSGFDLSGCQRGIGEICGQNDDCAFNLCYTESDEGYPNGYCTKSCEAEAGCPDGSACVDLLEGPKCFNTCANSAGCRPGYMCFDPFGMGETVCWPHCEDFDQCPELLDCNYWTGLCGDPATGADNGESCGGSSACKGTCTSWPQAPDDGYCVSPCSLATGACPGDAQCSDIYEGARGDMGLCLDGCTITEDCRTGFQCSPNPYGEGMVCIP